MLKDALGNDIGLGDEVLYFRSALRKWQRKEGVPLAIPMRVMKVVQDFESRWDRDAGKFTEAVSVTRLTLLGQKPEHRWGSTPKWSVRSGERMVLVKKYVPVEAPVVTPTN